MNIGTMIAMMSLKKAKGNFSSRSHSAMVAHLLYRIRVAKLPEDKNKFTWAEISESGLARKYTREPGWSEDTFKLVILLATQAKEFRRQRDRLQKEIEEMGTYCSPIWSELRNEPDPVKQAKIRFRAQADDARVALDRARKKEAKQKAIAKFIERSGRRSWRLRDRRVLPPEVIFWHEPMTLSAYHQATGISRRTLQNFLNRTNAIRFSEPKRKNEPAVYSRETNFTVLRHWLLKHEKNLENRRAWLIRILLKYSNEKEEHFDSVFHALLPVLSSLGIENETERQAIIEYWRKCEDELYPIYEPSPEFYLEVAAFLENSVGKKG